MQQRVQEMQEQLEGANVKVGSLEKVRHKLLGEIDDAQVDVERVITITKLSVKRRSLGSIRFRPTVTLKPWRRSRRASIK